MCAATDEREAGINLLWYSKPAPVFKKKIIGGGWSGSFLGVGGQGSFSGILDSRIGVVKHAAPSSLLQWSWGFMEMGFNGALIAFPPMTHFDVMLI